jgi:hypothetical protein
VLGHRLHDHGRHRHHPTAADFGGPVTTPSPCTSTKVRRTRTVRVSTSRSTRWSAGTSPNRWLLLVGPDGTLNFAGKVDGDPDTATEFIIAGPTLDVGDITLSAHMTGATSVALGLGRSCGVVAGGEVRCWGWNIFGLVTAPSSGG